MKKTFDFLGVPVSLRYQDDPRKTAVFVAGYLNGNYTKAVLNGKYPTDIRRVINLPHNKKLSYVEEAIYELGRNEGLGNTFHKASFTRYIPEEVELDTYDLIQRMQDDFSLVPEWAFPGYEGEFPSE